MNLQDYNLRQNDIDPNMAKILEAKRDKFKSEHDAKSAICFKYGANGNTEKALECATELLDMQNKYFQEMDELYKAYAKKIGK